MATTNGSSGYGTPQREGPPMPTANGTPMTQTTPDATGPPGAYPAVTNGRKRKADGTSSRGVANLTPEQLAKKRANDREAQRAIRERTRNQIETLERRIKELESQQPFQELQNALRQREQVQAENDDLKRRMQTIFSLLQPIAASQGLNDLAAATAQQSPLPMPQHQPQQAAAPPPQALMYHQQPNPYDAPPFAQHHIHPDLRNIQPAQPLQPPRPTQSPASAARQYAQAAQAAQQQQQQQQQQAQQQPQRFSPHQHFQPTLAPAPVPQHAQAQAPTDMNNHGYTNFLVEDRKAHPASPSLRDLIPPPLDSPLHMRLPRNMDATCPLDAVMLEFMTERRRAAAQGTSSSSLVGPAYPSISSLLNPAKAPKSHPLSKLFTDVLGNLPDIDRIPEQVACLYIMFIVMRWRIAPTQENFDRIPEWIRPIRSQLESVHPVWFDNVPWPVMRDRMIKNPSAYPNDRYGPLYCQTLSLNWPYDPQQCLLPRANSVQGAEATSAAVLGDDEEFMINPVFESHMRNLDNWSIGPAFANAFPELVVGIRVKESNSSPSSQTSSPLAAYVDEAAY